MKKIISWLNTNIVNKTIIFILIVIITTIFIHARFNKSEGVIIWDVKSYYSYLPATFIYQDLSFGFMDEDPQKFNKWIWPFESPLGIKSIRASMGMSVLYSPFFFIAHVVALLTPYEADGYSTPYHFALNFSAMFYLWLGMIFLVKVLRRYFNDKIIAFTLLAVVLGTNLFFYTTREAPMAHSFGFSLNAIFLWLTVKFYDSPSLKRIIIPGLLAGFIALVRPTNIIVLVIFFLWGVQSFAGFRDRIVFYLRRFHWVGIMAAAFILVWVPQFFYWHYISGQIFYFTYGEKGDGFFWHNPQIWNILVSYRKGWLVYTPLMLFAMIGIFFLPKKVPGSFLPILLFKLINIYILASWWSWWFGGGFGLRSFIESYAFLSLPFATFVSFSAKQKKFISIPVLGFLTLLIVYNQFQTRQYNNNAIHWWWMNKEAYWETFLKLHPTKRFWEVVTLPDYDAARQGIYRELKSPQLLKKEAIEQGEWFSWRQHIPREMILDWLTQKQIEAIKDSIPEGETDITDIAKLRAQKLYLEEGYIYWDRKYAIEMIKEEITGKEDYMEYLKEKALKNNNPLDSQIVIDARWIFENNRESKWSSWKQYIPENIIMEWLIEKEYQSLQDSISGSLTENLRIAEQRAQKKYKEKGYDYWDQKYALEMIIKEISNKPDYMEYLREKAKEKNNPLDSQIVIDAKWLLRNERDFN
ncbi:MAG: hypothetical protein ACLFQS_10675 [Bacteroidales bacterium]